MTLLVIGSSHASLDVLRAGSLRKFRLFSSLLAQDSLAYSEPTFQRVRKGIHGNALTKNESGKHHSGISVSTVIWLSEDLFYANGGPVGFEFICIG